MKLTEEQAQVVADNHQLIYWYCHLTKTDVEEHYGLLAIELCKTVMKYDETKGSLSNYYKIRCDMLMYKEYTKTQALKRKSNGVFELQDYTQDAMFESDITEMDSYVFENILLDSEYGELIKLKLDGYSQTEIGQKLGISQAQVSRLMKKVRDEFGYDR